MNLLPANTIGVNRIHHMDALALLNALPSNSVDLVFVDPPYNLNYAYDSHADNLPDAEYYQWCFRWLDESRRVLKPTGSLFVLNIPRHAITLANHLNQSMRFQHWIAWKAASRSSNKPLMPDHYALLYYTKSDQFTANEVRAPHKRCRKCGELIADYGGKKHLIHPYGPTISDVWSDIGREKHSQRGEHPCKLPERLVRRVIELATHPGDVVLDFFVGTGTTAVATFSMGRRFIVGDNSAFYCDITRRKVGQVTQDMFAGLDGDYAEPVETARQPEVSIYSR